MTRIAFFFAALGYLFISWFVYQNYPQVWRKNRSFRVVLFLWHLLGLCSLALIFTPLISFIPYENIRYEISRLGTFYYIPVTLMAVFFLIYQVISGAYLFIMKYTGKEIPERRWEKITNKRFFATLFTTVSFGICILGYFNIDFLHLNTYEIKVNAASQEKELNIVLVADVHAGAGVWEYTYDEMREMIDNCEGDVLILDGDIFDETTTTRDMNNFFKVLNSIKAPRYGIFYVSGNHDDDFVSGEMQKRGVNVLDDKMTLLGTDIQLIGIADKHRSRSDIDKLYEELSPDRDKPILTVIHRPINLSELSSLGSDLSMSGHTHGFNIFQFLGVGIASEMFSGTKQYGDMTAFTTSGVSAWGYHYKWPAQSEIAKIHLTFSPPH